MSSNGKLGCGSSSFVRSVFRIALVYLLGDRNQHAVSALMTATRVYKFTDTCT